MRAAIKDVFEGGGIQGGSTLTMQLVTNVYLPNEHQRPPQPAVQDHPGEARQRARGRALQELDPDPVPQRRAVRDGRRPDRDRRRRRLADVLRQAGPGPRPGPDRAAGGPAAGADRRTTRSASAGWPRWRRGQVLQAMVQSGYITRAQEQRANARRLRSSPTTSTRTSASRTSFDYVKQQLMQELGQATVDAGGLQGLHDDQPRRSGGRRARRSRRTRASPATRPRAGLDRPGQRAHPGAAELDDLRHRQGPDDVRLRHPGAAPDRLVVQGVRADDDDQGRRRRPEQHLLQLQAAGRRLAPQLPDLRRCTTPRTATSARSASPRRRRCRSTPSTPSSASTSGMSNVDDDRARDGHHLAAVRLPGRGDRRAQGRRLCAADGGRLRDAGQRRRPHRADDHLQGRARAASTIYPTATPEQDAGLHPRPGLRRHPDAEDGAPVRHRHRRQLRLPGGRQDRHDQQLHGRLVRRLHAAALDRRLGRLSELRRLHDRRQRARPGLRRHAGGADLEGLHGDRASDGYCGDFPQPVGLLARRRVLRQARRLGVCAAAARHDHDHLDGDHRPRPPDRQAPATAPAARAATPRRDRTPEQTRRHRRRHHHSGDHHASNPPAASGGGGF